MYNAQVHLTDKVNKSRMDYVNTVNFQNIFSSSFPQACMHDIFLLSNMHAEDWLCRLLYIIFKPGNEEISHNAELQ